MTKKVKLDPETANIAKRLLALPPKHHDEMKVGRGGKKKLGPKGRASSAKPRSASRTDRGS
jgi:hypothetical protein